MKKIIGILIVLVFILTSIACNKDDMTTTTTIINTTTEPIVLPEEKADFSLNREEISLVQFNQTYIQIIGKDKKDAIWKSSDENIAIVDNGVVTALNEGIATITATIGGVSKTCIIIVAQSNDYPLLILNQYDATILLSDDFIVTSELLFRGESVSSYQIELEVINDDILSASTNESNIIIHPIALGTTNLIVTATYNGMKTTKNIVISIVE